jgi:hypothetical protein
MIPSDDVKGAPMPAAVADQYLTMARELAASRSGGLSNPLTAASPLAQPESYGRDRLGIAGVNDSPQISLRYPFSEGQFKGALYAIYRQIFGNTYVMENERPGVAETELKDGRITVRGFIRQLAKSEIYKTRFLYKASQNRFIELNYKLLLGRAPYNQAEISQHLDLWNSAGYEAEIDSYIDSEEYQQNFGEDTVPYFRGFKYQTGNWGPMYSRLLNLYDGWAGSDTDRTREGQVARLNGSIALKEPGNISRPSALSAVWSEARPNYRSQPNAKARTGLDAFLAMAKEMVPVGPPPTSPFFLKLAQELTGPDRVQSLAQDMSSPSRYQQTETFGQERIRAVAAIETKKVTLPLNFTQEELQGVLNAVYRQVFGNTYVMENERPIIAESQLKNGQLTVRGFIRQLAKSEVYKSRFLYKASQNRFIELNHKLLLGRAPFDQGEISRHLDLWVNEGYDAEIDSYLDSAEYQETFGENTVPYFRGFKYQVGQTAEAFNRLVRLYDGWAGSDTDRNIGGHSARLTANLARGGSGLSPFIELANQRRS